MNDVIKLAERTEEAIRLCKEDREKLIRDCTNFVYWLTANVIEENLSMTVNAYPDAVLQHLWVDNYGLMEQCGILELDHYIDKKEAGEIWGRYYVYVKRMF